MHRMMICLAMLLGLGYSMSQQNSDCVWSFDIESRQVHKEALRSSLFHGQFPRRHFACGNNIFFFDSCGNFIKSLTISEDKRMRVSDCGELIYIRDDVLIYSDAAACSVQVLADNGDILCGSHFNIMAFDALVGIGQGKRYFTGPSSFYRCVFFDSTLHYLRNASEYYALEYHIVQTRKEVLFLASDIGGALNAVTEASLIYTDYEGNILRKITLGRIRTGSFHIKADRDRVVTCFEDDASKARLMIFDSQGETAYSVVLPYRPVVLSNILDGHFIILGNDDNSLVLHVYSARTYKSKAYPISHGNDMDALSIFSVELYKGNRLLISSRHHNTWGYVLYKRFNRLLDAATIIQRSRPIVIIDRNDILTVRTEPNRICIAR